MRLLIDTHVFVWATVQPDLLSSRAKALLADLENEVLLSAISAYEIEYKRERDPILQRIPSDLEIALAAQDIGWLLLRPEHASEAGKLPRHHGDPFDRLIIAQAILENTAIVTADRWFPAYGVSVIW
jgi:PIN domain nuclease of toxin-antitoxin system